MKKTKLFETASIYRAPLEVYGYRFGEGRQDLAVVGSMRGDEIQQMFICSQIVKQLKRIEEAGLFCKGRSVLVIPCVNPYSMNIGKRFWAMDDTDINRMFPGYDQGETTQRIAAGLFEHLQGWQYGVHFTSFYMRGQFVSHVRMMETAFADLEAAADFGLPFVVVRPPLPIDTTTLNYNWQIWNTKAYTIFTRETSRIDVHSARQAVHAVLRFLAKKGVIRYKTDSGRVPITLKENTLLNVNAPAGGLLRLAKSPGETVCEGDLLAEILDPYEGEVKSQLFAPKDGTVYFCSADALVSQCQILMKIIPGVHSGVLI
ncbi:MAG: succinylglutamate desuccinylase/aspartoacylase family protein [Duodenibacillus sp.]|nr:succinylglutamate desuccinylase/aspartoacylase family protein [Duodenibacillus sp.]